MSLGGDQLAAVRDLVAIAGHKPVIGGYQAMAFVGTIDAETGLPSMGGGVHTERSLSLVALSEGLPVLKRDMPVVISETTRAMKVEAWEEHAGFFTIECR